MLAVETIGSNLSVVNRHEMTSSNTRELSHSTSAANEMETFEDTKGSLVKNIRNVVVEVILDIAHNEDAMIALVAKFKGLYPNRILR